MSLDFFWLFLSYLFGSFPSGYLISKTYGKEILKIGWRKTSGSNVFRNVGKLAGALTGILDLAKGFLAVFFAQRLGFSNQVQILSGIAAIIGHNWSIFIRFAGGRGIGTLVGAFLALQPKILFLSIIPFILIALIWNTSIATLLFLVVAIFISIYYNQFQIIGTFIILSLFPILIKRLSPVEEIFKSERKLELIKNRLIFDNDIPKWDLRIKKLFKKQWWT